MSTIFPRGLGRARGWLRRWGPLLPLLSAELIVYIGFGALLPVLPLFVQGQGIDATTLGFIIAAWPIAKLIFEPFFGWWADRNSRRPLMIGGLVLLGLSSVLPLVFTSAVALFSLRFVSGAAVAMYDPAARGTIMEATEQDERGEAFGIYGAFQVGGFAIGPAIGALGAAALGEYAFPFVFTGILSLAAAAVLARRMTDSPHVRQDASFERHPEAQPLPAGVPFAASEVTGIPIEEPPPSVVAPPGAPALPPTQAPLSALLNRPLVAALVLAFGLHLSFGVYEVIWTLYLIALGATITWVGITFVLFAIPEMIFAPIAGRFVDRKGPIRFLIGSALVIMVSGAIYASASEPVLPSIVVPFEAAATAVMMPALFAMVASGTPVGRASTTQGLFGAASTLALVVASAVAGALFERGLGLPFWFFIAGMIVCLVVGLLVYRGAGPPGARSRSPR